MPVTTCANCKHRGADVEAGACYFCRADATSPVSSRHMHALAKLLGKRALAADKAERAEEKAAEKATNARAGKAKIYEATPAQLGLADRREVWRHLVRGDYDGVETAEGFDRAIRALSMARAGCFAHEKATYTVEDCFHVRAALGVHRVAEMARAIEAAAKDPWFIKAKDITFETLKKKASTLLAAPREVPTNNRDERAAIARELAAAIAELRELAPVEASERDINVDSMSVEALRAHLAGVVAEIERIEGLP